MSILKLFKEWAILDQNIIGEIVMWHRGKCKVKNWKENTVQNTQVNPLFLMWLNPLSADLYYNSYNELSAGHWGGVGHNELTSSDGTKHDRG